MVLEDGSTQKQASKRVKVKLETVKLILKKWRTSGTIFNKKMPGCKKPAEKTFQRQEA